jgi:hypothetical protein
VSAAEAVLERELGVTYQHSPAFTAENLLRGLLARRDECRALPLPSAAEHWRAVNEPTLAWVRALLPSELASPWVLAIDRRSAYLHSMLLCDVGLGEPHHVERPDWPGLIWTPGYYHARLRPWREMYLPDPVRLKRPGDWHWLTAPTLRLADLLGLVLDVDEAWVWPRKSRVLASIAQRLMRARAAPEGDAVAKDAYKRLVGRLRARFHRGTPLYRPDWYAHIVADARARIWTAAERTLDENEMAPAACNLDCWYYLADLAELPAAFDPKWWHLDAAAPAERVGLDCFGEDASVAALAKRVKAAAR